MRSTLRQALPPVYQGLLSPFFDETPPAEEKATCSSCAMCPPAGVTPPDGVDFFRPDAKCCTFFPTLPNYLLGALLADGDPALAEGQRRVRQRIAGRIGVTPRWIEPSRKHRLLHAASRVHAFGRSTVLRCPYFVEDGGRCSIWRHRDSVCGTWFCKYDDGADGEHFWKSLQRYLQAVEVALSRHALSVVAPELPVAGPDDNSGLSLEELEDRAPSDEDQGAAWGAWVGREEELYRRCHQVVAALAPEELPAIVGGEHTSKLAALVEAHQEVVRPRLPERLVLSRDVVFLRGEEGAVALGYSRFDPMFLSTALIEVLRTLKPEETVAGACERLREEGIEVPGELWLTLYRARILVQPGAT